MGRRLKSTRSNRQMRAGEAGEEGEAGEAAAVNCAVDGVFALARPGERKGRVDATKQPGVVLPTVAAVAAAAAVVLLVLGVRIGGLADVVVDDEAVNDAGLRREPPKFAAALLSLPSTHPPKLPVCACSCGLGVGVTTGGRCGGEAGLVSVTGAAPLPARTELGVVTDGDMCGVRLCDAAEAPAVTLLTFPLLWRLG